MTNGCIQYNISVRVRCPIDYWTNDAIVILDGEQTNGIEVGMIDDPAIDMV